MKRPAFQFYPKDWRGNMKLRRCSDAAKGAWIEILCVLHDSEEYGVARFRLAELVTAAGVKARSVQELVDKGVLKGAELNASAFIYTPRHAGKDGHPVELLAANAGPMWYCSRFVEDEYRRKNAGSETRFKPTKPPGGSQPSRAPDTTPNSSPRQRDGTHEGYGSAVAVCSLQSAKQHQPSKQHHGNNHIPEEPPSVAALLVLFEPSRVQLDAKARMHARQWAAEGVTPQQLTDTIAIARERKTDGEMLYAGYLATILPEVRSGRQRREMSQAEIIARTIAAVNAEDAANASH